MKQPDEELVELAVEKSKKALQDAEMNINNNSLENALNRIYYSIFYIVTALAYKNNFGTSKHYQLRAWFNKKFIYEEKVLDKVMYKIYDETFEYRQRSDYDIRYVATLEKTKDLLADAKKFINEVLKII